MKLKKRAICAPIVLAAAFVAVGGLNHSTPAQCGYEVTAIIKGPDCGWELATVAPQALNDHGQVVGFYYCAPYGSDKPFLWDDGELIVLDLPEDSPSGQCFDINNSGQITGMAYRPNTGRSQGFMLDGDEGVLFDIPDGGDYSRGMAINEAGVVAGYWGEQGMPLKHGFIWQDGVTTSLADVLQTPKSSAYGINDAGQITGKTDTGLLADTRAFRIDGDSVIHFDPVPGGFTSQGSKIDNLGRIAGHGYWEDPEGDGNLWRSFFWDGIEMVDLGFLPGYRQSCRVYCMGENGEVGGECYAEPQDMNAAFIWQDGMMQNLNDLIDPHPDILNLTTAMGINASGQIAVRAYDVDSNTVAVLLTPIERPPTDLTGDCHTDVEDLLMLLGEWGEGESDADFDDNGVVDVIDLLFLLGGWDNP